MNELLRQLEWAGITRGQGSGPMSSGGEGPLVRCCPCCRGIDPSTPGSDHFRKERRGHTKDCDLHDKMLRDRDLNGVREMLLSDEFLRKFVASYAATRVDLEDEESTEITLRQDPVEVFNAAIEFREMVVSRADGKFAGRTLWGGWVIVAAFRAGVKWLEDQ